MVTAIDFSNKDISQYFTAVLKGRSDPLWFAENILGVSLFPTQTEIMGDFYSDDYKRLVLVAGMRSGKSISPDSIIHMSDGSRKRLRDVQVGDNVLCVNDDLTTSRRVLDVLDSGIKEGYEIELYGGHKLVASAEHKLLTKISQKRVTNYDRPYIDRNHDRRHIVIDKKGWVKTEDLEKGDYIALPRNLHHDGIDKYSLNHYEILGYLLGDGSIIKSVLFTAENDEVTEHLRSILPHGTYLNKRAAKYQYGITGENNKNSILVWLRSIGMMGLNSHTKYIPDFVFTSSQDAIARLVSGLIVTDGHVSKKEVCYYTVSKQLADDYSHCLRLLGIVPNIRTKIGQYNGEEHVSYDVSFNRIEDLEIADNKLNLLHKHPALSVMVDTKDSLCHQGKNKNYYIGDTQYKKIKSITSVGKIHMMDLEIEGTHNYIANGICSHNSALASIMTAYEYFLLCTLDDPAKYYGLMPNQLISISCVAASESQAKDTIFSNTRNMIKNSSFFKTWTDTYPKEMELTSDSKHIQIRTISSSATTAVGRSNKAVIFDELANFEESTSKKGAWSIYERLIKSTDTFGGDGHVISISSPRHPTDIMMTLYKRGLEEKNTLALMRPTWDMNPHLTKESLLIEHKYNMQAFWRDYACQPGAYSAVQFPEGVTMDKRIENVLENTITDNIVPHVLSIDPAIRNDAFGMATAYMDINGRIVVDGCSKFERLQGAMMINPIEVREFIDKKIKELNIHTVVFDVWMFPELYHHLECDLGMNMVKHIVLKEDYDRWRELQTDGLTRVLYDEFLKLETEALVIKNEKKVDHTTTSSKDVSDCVANCMWYLTEDTGIGDVPPIFIMMGH